jgi:hypothetical protein
MKAYIASLLPEEGCRIVVAVGPEGEVWVDINLVRYSDGQFDRHLETNSWNPMPTSAFASAVRLRQLGQCM